VQRLSVPAHAGGIGHLPIAQSPRRLLLGTTTQADVLAGFIGRSYTHRSCMARQGRAQIGFDDCRVRMPKPAVSSPEVPESNRAVCQPDLCYLFNPSRQRVLRVRANAPFERTCSRVPIGHIRIRPVVRFRVNPPRDWMFPASFSADHPNNAECSPPPRPDAHVVE